MKHSLNKNQSIKSFLNGSVSSLDKINIDFLPVFLSNFKTPVVVACSPSNLKRLMVVFASRVGNDVVCVGRDLSRSPLGFLNFYENLFSVSKNFINNGLKGINICLVDEFFIGSPLFDIVKADFLRLTGETGYDDFLRVLEKYNYIADEGLGGDGFYYVRGGVVDVCPAGEQQKYRVSFLQKNTVIYKLNGDGFIEGEVDFVDINNIKNNKKESVLDLFDKKFLFLKFNKNCLSRNQYNTKKNVSLDVLSVDFQEYTLNKNNHFFIYSSLLQDCGFLFGGNYYVPSWFGVVDIKKNIQKNSNDVAFVVGAYYTHIDFGLCKFLGLEEDLKGIEFFCLGFQDGKIRLASRLVNKLFFYGYNLNGASLGFLSKQSRWVKIKKRAKQQAQDYVKELVLYYKKRRVLLREPYKINLKTLNAFIGAFEYKDTADQASSWADLLADLSSNKPMNRLLCGDVGFGKTEIAMRATFVVSSFSKKTIIMAPTTILASQLYKCFNKRLSVFGVLVGLYFRGHKNKKNIDNFVSGNVDVLVTTHAILRKKKALSACSFFIVDEEHRFGVKDKELVFNFNDSVDYLSLSATPIPRTLQMALSKIKNTSFIKSPPVSRKPIISQLCYYDFDLFVSFVFDEINRGGQVYFVDNSVDNVDFYYNKLTLMYPNIRFSKIYGSLPASENEKTMSLFLNKKIDVLFSTTIIESGVDIPTVNTMIINNAHLFGLSQLYQLRGRVGRSFVQAFCYFFIPKNLKLTSVAKKRLDSILKNGSFGSGYNLSVSDLDIRGFGSLFGYRQSGLLGVSYNFYSKLINDVLSSSFDNKDVLVALVDVSGGFVSKKYISSEGERAKTYKDIYSANSQSSVLDIEKKLVQSYGFCHRGVLLLLKDRLLSFSAAEAGINSIVWRNGCLLFSFNELFYKQNLKFLIQTIDSFCKKTSIIYTFNSNKNLLTLSCRLGNNNSYLFSKKLIGALIK